MESMKIKLHEAAHIGDLQAVQELIDKGVEVNNYADLPEGDTPLINAVEQNREEVVDLLLKSGASPNKINVSRCLPMHFAAQAGYVNIGRLLMRHSSLVDVKNVDGWTPLMWAVYKRKEEMVEILLNDGNASVDKADNENWLPIHLAAQEGNVNIGRMLLQHNSPVDPKTDDEYTPLILAVANRNMEMIKLLLEDGKASVNKVGYRGCLPICYAVNVNNVDIFRLLLLHGSLINAKDEDGWTPLMLAVNKQNNKMVQLLLEEGNASVTEADNNGWLPIHRAAQQAWKMVKMLLQHNSPVNPKTQHGSTPLMVAAMMRYSGASRITQVLLEEGNASVFEADNDGWLAIHFAACMGNLIIGRMLLQHNSPVDPKTKKGWTPLMHAVQHKHIMANQIEQEDMVGLLLEEGNASVMERNDEGWLPIHIAAKEGCVKIVQHLLKKGDTEMQLHARTNRHDTPLLRAAANGHNSVCIFLIEQGADVNAINDTQNTSLMYAAQAGHVSTVNLLLEADADPRAQNVYDQTVLFLAVTTGSIKMVQAILPYMKAEDLMLEDEEGNTAVFKAARTANFEIMDLILSKGVGQKLWRSKKSTILHALAAALDGKLTHLQCNEFKELIHEQPDGFTPAQLALRTNNIKNCMVLIDSIPDLKKEESIILMALALRHAHINIVDCLLKRTPTLLQTTDNWIGHLTSITRNSEQRQTILNEYEAWFKNASQNQITDAIANAIKNHHSIILRKLIQWVTDLSQLADIWPLWTAIDIGHDDIALFLLDLDYGVFKNQPGPDGTLPIELSTVRDITKVLAALTNKLQEEEKPQNQNTLEIDSVTQCHDGEELVADSQEDNQFVALCKKYPLFNENCSLPFKVGQFANGEFSFYMDILPYLVDVSNCVPINNYQNKHSDNGCSGHQGDKKVLGCNILTTLVKFVFEIEDELNKLESFMHQLKPTFHLVGSIPEGTRLGHPDELDMSVMFGNIKETFFEITLSDAIGLKLSVEGFNFFANLHKSKELKDLNFAPLVLEENMLNIIAFQHYFLAALEVAIPKLTLPPHVQLGMLSSDFDITKCNECVETSNAEGTWMLCPKCFPLLSQTKRGIVLNLIWINGDIEYKCSIDLISLYPVPEKDLSKLFGSVARTLMVQKPPGWQRSMEKYVQVDRPIHDGFIDLKNNGPDKLPLLIAMKVLNYRPGCNYIQAPGQSTGLQHFANRRIREAYVFTKGLIKLLNLSDQIKSYYLKKVFLNDNMIELSQMARCNADFILSILSQPEWGTLFKDHLDMDKMERKASKYFERGFYAYLK